MALKDDCSGVAGRTSQCAKKAELARECPDLTPNFDACWARIQASGVGKTSHWLKFYLLRMFSITI